MLQCTEMPEEMFATWVRHFPCHKNKLLFSTQNKCHHCFSYNSHLSDFQKHILKAAREFPKGQILIQKTHVECLPPARC